MLKCFVFIFDTINFFQKQTPVMFFNDPVIYICALIIVDLRV